MYELEKCKGRLGYSLWVVYTDGIKRKKITRIGYILLLDREMPDYMEYGNKLVETMNSTVNKELEIDKINIAFPRFRRLDASFLLVLLEKKLKLDLEPLEGQLLRGWLHYAMRSKRNSLPEFSINYVDVFKTDQFIDKNNMSHDYKRGEFIHDYLDRIFTIYRRLLEYSDNTNGRKPTLNNKAYYYEMYHPVLFDPNEVLQQRYRRPFDYLYMVLRVTFIYDNMLRLIDVGYDKFIYDEHSLFNVGNATLRQWEKKYELEELTNENVINEINYRYESLLKRWTTTIEYEDSMISSPKFIGLYYISDRFRELIIHLISKEIFNGEINDSQVRKFMHMYNNYNDEYPNINNCYQDEINRKISDLLDLPELLLHYWSSLDQDSFIKKIKEYNFEK